MKKFFFNLMKKLFGKELATMIQEEVMLQTCKIRLEVQQWKEAYEPLSDAVSLLERRLTPEKVQRILDPSLYVFPEKELKIRITKIQTNRDALTFSTSKNLRAVIGGDHDIIGKFSDIEGVSTTYVDSFGGGYQLLICKSPAIEWDEIKDKIIEKIASFFEDIKKEEPAAVA